MTYLDHFEAQVVRLPAADGGVTTRSIKVCTHSWAEHTAARLAWIYGAVDRTVETQADVARWNALGRRAAA